MTNRERIERIGKSFREVNSHFQSDALTHKDMADSSQVSSAGYLAVIASILDEMNEREKAKAQTTAQVFHPPQGFDFGPAASNWENYAP